MPPLSRRDLLKSALGAGVVTVLAGCDDGLRPAATIRTNDSPLPTPAPVPDKAMFTHGVASGDPLSDAVILWTRAVPADITTGRARIGWRIALDPALTRVIASGIAESAVDRDWTIKLDVTGLAAGTAYYYRFDAADTASPVGRTRTAPTGAVDRLRLAFVTCAKYTNGYFSAYRRVAERSDLIAVVHLGDYIYESASGDGVREHVPAKETETLADYRARYALHRSDADLAELHRQHPMIWVWDDHEVANNAWSTGAEAHDEATEGPYTARRMAGFRAAFEWLPIRPPDANDPTRVFRAFQLGTLADLTMIDARHFGRVKPAAPNTVFGSTVPVFTQTGAFADASREILGVTQQAWLKGQLTMPRAKWRLIGNQIYFSPLKLVGAPRAAGTSVFLSNDKWDGYEPARDRALAGMQGVKNLVILTGDAHENYAFDVVADPNNPVAYNPVTGAGASAVEFVVTSISTRGDGDSTGVAGPVAISGVDPSDLLPTQNPHLKYYDGAHNGYLLLDVTTARVQSEFWVVPMVGMPTTTETCDRVFVVNDGVSHLVDGGAPTAAIPGAPAPAP